MHPRIYQSLRVFIYVGEALNLSEAARSLNMTKGAVSYQIKQLERGLEFEVFERTPRGLAFTERGQTLFNTAARRFDQLDRQISALRDQPRQLTVGMTTYFASRWLAPRLMRFTSRYPDVRLRIQPTEGLVDLHREQIDLAILWGDGVWNGRPAERLFYCPAFATCDASTYERARTQPLDAVIGQAPLLHDIDGSPAWRRWCANANIPYPASRVSLVIPDPNVRVEAVINGQGLALNDALVGAELASGRLFRLSDHALDDYGYFLVYRDPTAVGDDAERFHHWIVDEAHLDDHRQ